MCDAMVKLCQTGGERDQRTIQRLDIRFGSHDGFRQRFDLECDLLLKRAKPKAGRHRPHPPRPAASLMGAPAANAKECKPC